jgi:serine/threonine protein kinase
MGPCQHCGRTHPPGTTQCPITGDSLSYPGLIGGKIDRYAVEALLGAGGFGAVYRARHVHTDATVALKLLKRNLGADAQMIERFLREAKAAAAIGSEHIVKVTDAGVSTEGQAFLAMELLEGSDLKELSQKEPLPPVRLVLLLLQVLDALAVAHARGIVHRDMKPANVFVVRRRDERGTERDFVKLLDFGISKMHGDGTGSGLTMTGVAMGTPTYMAPEQFFDARSVDGRADVYSVAVMAYELFSGRLPLDAQSYAELILKVRSEQPLPLLQVAPQVPAPLAQVVTVGLAKEAQHRWQSAAEFSQALRSAAGLPAPGSTPAFVSTPASLSRATPVEPSGLEQTHTPAKIPSEGKPKPASGWVATPGFVSQPVAPPASQPPSGPPTGWPPPPPGPMPPGPPPGFAPPGPPPGFAPPGFPPPPFAPPGGMTPGAQPAKKSSATKWLLIILGLMFALFGCCTCTYMMAPSQTPNIQLNTGGE